MSKNMVHVEVLDKSMNVEYIVAMPASIIRQASRLVGIMYDGKYYTHADIKLVLGVPGSFIVRKRRFENERIS